MWALIYVGMHVCTSTHLHVCTFVCLHSVCLDDDDGDGDDDDDDDDNDDNDDDDDDDEKIQNFGKCENNPDVQKSYKNTEVRKMLKNPDRYLHMICICLIWFLKYVYMILLHFR